MSARVPLDIDLEDRIVYGLTPMRLAYAVLAVLAAMAIWSLHEVFELLRIVADGVVLASGAVLAWGRIGGRPADAWLYDLVLFIASTRRLRWRRSV